MKDTQCFQKLPLFVSLILTAFVAIHWSPVLAEWNKIESPCLCQEFRCGRSERNSSNVFCLHATKVCNGAPDCVGGEDEKGYNGTGKCVRKRAKCSQDEFKCKFGDCIKLEQVCDGKIDCWGAVDEAIDFCTWVHGNETEYEAISHPTSDNALKSMKS